MPIKNSIKNYNFNDYYEIIGNSGADNFDFVHKYNIKKTEDIFAVKIINKPKLKMIDLALARQEKNLLKIIKNENIISLLDFF